MFAGFTNFVNNIVNSSSNSVIDVDDAKLTIYPEEKSLESSQKLHIIMLLDESGSMGSIKNEAIEGVNGFINEQQKVKTNDEVIFDLITFSGSIYSIISGKSLKNVSLIDSSDYNPNGMTVLYDAIGHVFDKYEEEKDVILVVMTDGEDTASKKYKRNEIIERLNNKKNNPSYNWQIVWLGADATIADNGTIIGASSSAAVDFRTLGYYCSTSLSSAVSDYRTGKTKSVNL